MAPIEGLHLQHLELLDLAAKLEATLDAPHTPARISDARCQLSTLLGKLQVHDVAERRSLYPALARCEDEAVRRLVGRFDPPMGGLLARVEALSQAWSEARMHACAPAFRAEFAELSARLRERVALEEAELYPAAEGGGLHGATASSA